MIKALTASLLFAASFGQAPPSVVNVQPAVPAVPANPEMPAVPANPEIPANPANPEYIPSNPEVPAAPATPTEPAIPALPLLPPGEFYGAFGQICVPDPLKDVACKTAGAAAIEQYPGFMKCERGYDCCLCGSVSCGNAWDGCNTFSAGDSGIKGVKNVNIIGRAEQLGGAEINCIGIEACADSTIKGERIKGLDAAGALSLRNAVVTIVNPVPDFNLDCVGIGGCENLKLEIIIEGPPPGYQCNSAIDPQTIEFNSLQCSGQESCKNMQLTIDNRGCNVIEIQQIECILPSSCMGASFNFIGAVEVNSCDIRGGAHPPAGLEKCFGGVAPGNPGLPVGNQNWIPL